MWCDVKAWTLLLFQVVQQRPSPSSPKCALLFSFTCVNTTSHLLQRHVIHSPGWVWLMTQSWKSGMGSQGDCLPMGIPPGGSGIVPTLHARNWAAVFIVGSSVSGHLLADQRNLESWSQPLAKQRAGPRGGPRGAQVTEVCPLRLRNVTCDGPIGSPQGPASLYSVTLITTWITSERKGSEPHSAPLGSGLTFVTKTRPRDPVSALDCVNCPLPRVFIGGLCLGWTQFSRIEDAAADLRTYLSTLYSVVKHCLPRCPIVSVIFWFNAHWFILINILSFIKFVFFLL